jgi:membrane protein DedA with SNARE-associated domain
MAKKQRGALAWGIILIVIGLIFILDNLDVDVWDSLARLWPLVLIVWGAWKLYFGLKERKEQAPVQKTGQD